MKQSHRHGRISGSILAAVILAATALAGTPSGPSEHAQIAEILLNHKELAKLDAKKRELLAPRVQALLDSRQQPTVDEYMQLLRSWGGKERLDPNSQQFREWITNDWHAPGSNCAWQKINLDSIDAAIVSNVGLRGSESPAWPRNENTGVGAIAPGIFNFAGGLQNLAKNGASVIQISIPVETVDGSQILFSMRWVWCETASNWLPWMAHQSTTKGESLCPLVY